MAAFCFKDPMDVFFSSSEFSTSEPSRTINFKRIDDLYIETIYISIQVIYVFIFSAPTTISRPAYIYLITLFSHAINHLIQQHSFSNLAHLNILAKFLVAKTKDSFKKIRNRGKRFIIDDWNWIISIPGLEDNDPDMMACFQTCKLNGLRIKR